MKNSNLLFPLRGLALLVFSLFFLTSCGGGGGDSKTTTAANSEVINGIAVPPEPDPEKNNATVAGIDKNNNGVRDDVERKIAQDTGNSNLYSSYLILAKVESQKIGAYTGLVSQDEYAKAFCTEIAANDPVRRIDNLIVNNIERLKSSASAQEIEYETPTCN